MTSPTPEPRSDRTPDQAELHGSSSCARSSSGELEVGIHVPASSVTVRGFRAENLDRLAVADFANVEAAIRWCGVDLSWTHVQMPPNRTLLIGSDKAGRSCATVSGPLLAVLPDCCEVEVL